jgi:hypothetical protein
VDKIPNQQRIRVGHFVSRETLVKFFTTTKTYELPFVKKFTTTKTYETPLVKVITFTTSRTYETPLVKKITY